MNKNLLLLLGAGGVFWYLRNQQANKATNPTTPATAYTPVPTYVPTTQATTQASAGPNWLNTAAGYLSAGASLVQTGATAWNDVKGALNLSKAADVPASIAPVRAADVAPDVAGTDGSANGVWAGPVEPSTSPDSWTGLVQSY